MKPLTLLLFAIPAYACTAPTNLAAVAKGPTQINLTWTAASDPCYGYIVEVTSAGDSRYSSYTEVQPIPTAGGWACDPSILINGASCTYADNTPPYDHIYNPAVKFLYPWVTESQYIDPADGTAAQFIHTNLKMGATYTYRVRTFTSMTSPTYSSYSGTASATTATYAARYVSPSGDNTNGLSPATAWTTLHTGSRNADCGQILYVLAGSYPLDDIAINKTCTVNNRLVVQFNIGDTIDFTVDNHNVGIFTGALDGGGNRVLSGDYIVFDGVKTRYVGTWDTNMSDIWELWSSHVSLLSIECGTNVVPSLYGCVRLRGPYALVTNSYIHDVGSPEEHQNFDGQAGFPLWMNSYGVIVNNHISRGGHDDGVCITQDGTSVTGTCHHNRYLNNVLDGGWGTGVVTGTNNESGDMLVEGNFMKDVGYFITLGRDSLATKACVQVGAPDATIRRNQCIVSGYTLRLFEFTASCDGNSIPTCGANNIKMYNNILYSPSGTIMRALFGSANYGASNYTGLVVANNLFQNIACTGAPYMTEMYLAAGLMEYNAFYTNGTNAACNTGHIFEWDRNNNGAHEYTLAELDTNTGTPTPGSTGHWSANAALAVAATYVDAANYDFHLSLGSPLKNAGTAITDPVWGFPGPANPDLGAFGLVPTTGGGTAASSSTRVSSRTSH